MAYSSGAIPQSQRQTVPLMIAAIDGPVGTGKSVLAGQLARRLNWRALDTGAMYRALAWKALHTGVGLDNEQALAQLAAALKIKFSTIEGEERVTVEGEDVTRALRTPEVSAATALAARHGAVRQAMVAQQRRLGEMGRVVAEGRDMGTVVFPDALVKFYLTASVGERFRRRRLQMEAQGQAPPLAESLLRQLRERDALDRRREAGALRIAADACVLDSTNFAESMVLDLMVALVESTLGEQRA